MDPVTALGLACNVLDLVEKAIQCGKIVWKLHKDGFTDDQADLETVADTMEAVVSGLQKAPNKVKVRKSDLDPQIAKLLTRSAGLCASLRDLIKKCKPDTQGSWRAAGVAALKKLVHKSEIESVEKELETCRVNLIAIFSAATRNNIAYMQVDLKQVSMETSHISKKLEDLDCRLETSTDDVRKQLETLLAAFQEAQDLIKERLILKCLAFADMDSRFQTIHRAEPDTFDWIFNDPKMLLQKESELEISFTDWLKSGSGIFHVVGKPGSGKSTLMKFLCEREETQEGLQEWADAKGRELVFWKFFFWRITTIAEQKTLKGLIRGLLYGVISQVPSLARRLFPKQWAPKGVHHRDLLVELGDSEISDAFETLMKDTEIFDEFSLCFFIDGLDEFEQNVKLQRDTHYSLATKLKKWATDSGGHVKMCVSSRPLPEFTGTFGASQRITLQKLTANDIRTLVRNRLEQNECFAELKQRSGDEESRCDALVEQIIEEAKGVFLWVALILNELEQALASGDSLEMLEKIVATAHKELKEFFKSILESIPKRYRQGSYYLLAAVMRMSGILTSEKKAAVAILEKLDATIQAIGFVYHITLEDCALFFDTDDKGKLLDCDEALAVFTRDLRGDKKFMKEEKARLLTRCRGLVEVDLGQNIQFTHRSIPESLQGLFSEDELEERVHDEKVAEMLAWIALADIRQRWEHELGEEVGKNTSAIRLAYISMRLRICPLPLPGSEKIMGLLYKIKEAILLPQYGTSTPSDDQWKARIWTEPRRSAFLHILTVGTYDFWQLYEFAGWEIDTKLSPDKDKIRLLIVLCEIVSIIGANFSEISREPLELVIGKMLERGVTLDACHAPGFIHGECAKVECQVWHEFLYRELFFGATGGDWRGSPVEDERMNWRGLETLLRFGADPDVYLSEGEQPGQGLLTGPAGEVLYGNFAKYHKGFVTPLWQGTLSLMDYVEFCEPPNMNELLRLIQRNMAKKSDRSSRIMTVIEDRTDHDVPADSAGEASDPVNPIAQEPRHQLAPRQTW